MSQLVEDLKIHHEESRIFLLVVGTSKVLNEKIRGKLTGEMLGMERKNYHKDEVG